MNIKKIVLWIAIIIIGGFVLIQLVPYGRNHENPPVQSEPAWDSPDTRALAEAACFDCHSNETEWNRWYESVAPASWLVQRDVDQGRRHVNFSEWDQGGKPRELGELWETVQYNSMPPQKYLIMNPQAKLTSAEKERLIAGLQASTRN